MFLNKSQILVKMSTTASGHFVIVPSSVVFQHDWFPYFKLEHSWLTSTNRMWTSLASDGWCYLAPLRWWCDKFGTKLHTDVKCSWSDSMQVQVQLSLKRRNIFALIEIWRVVAWLTAIVRTFQFFVLFRIAHTK